MKSNVFPWAVGIVAALALAAGTGALAQGPAPVKFRGVINDFTPASTGGPWEVRGHWSLEMKGKYGRGDSKADFSAALTMERSDLGVMQNGGGDLNNPADRMAHTHHITLVDGEVTAITGGIQVTGPATVTANGVFPPPFGSTLPIVDYRDNRGRRRGQRRLLEHHVNVWRPGRWTFRKKPSARSRRSNFGKG